jgi:hypothetical protein
MERICFEHDTKIRAAAEKAALDSMLYGASAVRVDWDENSLDVAHVPVENR